MELEEKKFKQLEEIQGDIDKLNEHANNEFFWNWKEIQQTASAVLCETRRGY